MNDINNMPMKCQYCPYWEVCEPPYVCNIISGVNNDKKGDNKDMISILNIGGVLPRREARHCSDLSPKTSERRSEA